MGRIEDTLKRATDLGYPAGMAQAGLQLATVDVPWLLERIKELELEHDNQEPVLPAVGFAA